MLYLDYYDLEELDIFSKITRVIKFYDCYPELACYLPSGVFDPKFFKKITFHLLKKDDAFIQSEVLFGEGCRKVVKSAMEQVKKGSSDYQILNKIYDTSTNYTSVSTKLFNMNNLKVRKCIELAGDYYSYASNNTNCLLRKMEANYDELLCIDKDIYEFFKRELKIIFELRAISKNHSYLFSEIIPGVGFSSDEYHRLKKEREKIIKTAGGIIRMHLPEWFQAAHKEIIKNKEYCSLDDLQRKWL